MTSQNHLLRPATHSDVEILVALERDANMAALAHVFPPDRFPFPTEATRDSWRRTLAEPDVSVMLATARAGESAEGEPQGYIAFTGDEVLHLAVAPTSWGSGLARSLLRHALEQATGPEMRLWVIEANHRARGFYEHLGWVPTGEHQKGPFPPYPAEIRLVAPVLSR